VVIIDRSVLSITTAANKQFSYTYTTVLLPETVRIDFLDALRPKAGSYFAIEKTFSRQDPEERTVPDSQRR